MPYTPYHWGPSSWIGLLFFKYFDFPTLMVSSVIVDIEPFCVIVFNLKHPMHGFLHTFLGGSIAAVITAFFCYLFRNPIKKEMKRFKLAQNSSFKKILWTSFFGVYSHIILDGILYPEMNPFYPLKGNPFLGLLSYDNVYLFCKISFLIGFFIYIVRFYLKK